MNKLKLMALAGPALLGLSGPPALADQVVADDLIIVGSQCVGQDCVNGQDFTGITLEIKENNNRIKLYDSAAVDVLGQHWNVAGNASQNGGQNYLAFEANSVTQDDVQRSDGFQVTLDCTEGQTFPYDPFTPGQGQPELGNQPVPFGSPLLMVELVQIDNENVWQCQTIPWFTVDTMFKASADGEDHYVTLGSNAQPVAGQVSVGNPGQLERITHVADPEQATDVLTVGQLELPDSLRLAARRTAVDQLRQQVEALKEQIETLKQGDADGDGIPNGVDAYPLVDTRPVPVASPIFLLVLAASLIAVARRRPRF